MTPHAKIIGLGTYKPNVVSNNEFINVFGKKAKIISDKLAHNTRYSAIDLKTGKVYITNTEMAYQASIEALKIAGIKATDLNMIIYSTSTPDFPLPPCCVLLQEKLGINSCMVMDIRSGCSGFTSGLITAQQFIMTGAVKNVLVVGADLTSSRFCHLFESDRSKFPLKGLYNLMLFGDAAGAIVLSGADNDNEGIFLSSMGSNKATLSFGSKIEIGGSVNPYPDSCMKKEDWAVSQDGPLTEEVIPMVLVESVNSFLRTNRIQLSTFDKYVLPIESPKMVDIVKNGIEGFDMRKVVSIGSEGGSLVNAAIPLSLEKGYKNNLLKKGEKILIFASENTRWQHAILAVNWNL